MVLKKYIKNFTQKNHLFGVILTDFNDNIFIIFRGTVYLYEWKTNFKIDEQFFFNDKKSTLDKLKLLMDKDDNPMIHKGFVEIYMNIRKDIFDTLKIINPNKNKNIIISGHSIGGSISTILGIDLYFNKYKIIVYSIGSPRVGNKDFAKLVKRHNINIFQIINIADIVPDLPFSILPKLNNYKQSYEYTHCGIIKTFLNQDDSIIKNHSRLKYFNSLNTKKLCSCKY